MPAKLLIVCYILIGKSKITNIANKKQKEGDKECGIREERRIE
jgi:hypothetical protein